MTHPLQFLPGDVPPVAASRAAGRSLEVRAGQVRLLQHGSVRRQWDVEGCALSEPYGPGPTSYFVDFVAPDGTSCCTIDLAAWTPGVRDVPPQEWRTLGAPLRDVRSAVALAAAVQQQVRAADDVGSAAVPEDEMPRAHVALALLVAAVFAAGDVIALSERQPVAYAIGGVAAIVLAALLATPRAWWPRGRLQTTHAVDLGGGTSLGLMAGTVQALALSSRNHLSRFLPLGSGPTAIAHAHLDRTAGLLCLTTRAGTRVQVEVAPGATEGLETLLRQASVPVAARSLSPMAPRTPMSSTGTMGDAVPGSGQGLAVLFLAAGSIAAVAGNDYVAAAFTHGVAALLALAGAVAAARQDRRAKEDA